ncbi:xanthine phosphoribosyltransferase [Desulfovibrio cuneatus]|uniref:xanthine phosphoribosyltransferase n=1 Tax=Desulfovibrio cuneatus TaxID=159728 RepID=UPI00040A395E|nr:xanthine phosphoribosyltransferase [Desulfovibrio cuneatus]
MSGAERYTQQYPVSWAQLHRDTKALAARLVEMGPFKGIIAVTRGGLVPTAVVARELEIHMIETMCLVSYDWQSQNDGCTILKTVEGDGKGWLVLDDLVDTGKTMAVVRELLPEATLAAIYAKPGGVNSVDVYVSEVSQDTWILFPWDVEAQYVKPLVARCEK